MRNISFLLFSLFLIQESSAFTVVLKSGKRIEGTKLGQDTSTLQLKDNNGTVLSFRKSTVDENATAAANPPEPQDSNTIDSTRKPQQTIVQIAAESKRSRTGKARLLTNMDVEGLPEISVLSDYDPAWVAVKSTEESSVPSKEERYWRTTSASLKREVSLLTEKQISARNGCSTARDKAAAKRKGPHQKPVDFLVLIEDPIECERLAEIERRLREAQNRIFEFEERARKSQIPWQWLE